MSLGHGASIVRDGLVLHLDAANSKSYLGSGTSWNDLSGFGNNGTLINGVGYLPDNKGSLVFDGVDDFSTLSENSLWAIGSNGTLEILVYATGSITTNHRFWCTNNNASSLDAYIDRTTGRVGFHAVSFFTQSQFPFNQWTVMTVVYSSGVPSVYFNGISQNLTGNLSNYNITNTNTLFIGQFAGGGNYRFRGNISNFKIYNRALTAAEIKQNFEATRSRYSI